MDCYLLGQILVGDNCNRSVRTVNKFGRLGSTQVLLRFDSGSTQVRLWFDSGSQLLRRTTLVVDACPELRFGEAQLLLAWTDAVAVWRNLALGL